MPISDANESRLKMDNLSELERLEALAQSISDSDEGMVFWKL